MGGIFEVRVYSPELNFRKIAAPCKDKKEPYGVNVRLLNDALSMIDFDDIRRRRKLFNRLYHEAVMIITHQHKKGISFTDMLLLLAHHKLIRDKEALV